MEFKLIADWTIVSSLLCALAAFATVAAASSVRWFWNPRSVHTKFHPDESRLPRRARKLRAEIESSGFILLGLRRETQAEEAPYIAVTVPLNAEFEAREPDLFLTVPPDGDEDFYLLTTYRDSLALVTAAGPIRHVVDEPRFDYLCLAGTSVSLTLSEHRRRQARHEQEGRVRSGLSGASGRESACRIVFATPHFQRKGRVLRGMLLGLLAALWCGTAALSLLGHVPQVEYLVRFLKMLVGIG